MAKKTRKFNAAMRVIHDHNIKLKTRENSDVYDVLNSMNFFWNAKDGTWEQKDHAPSTSVFQADDGTPTGIIKIRVMAHPQDLEAAIFALKSASGIRVIEISEKSYPNRKGTGERIYTTAILDAAL